MALQEPPICFLSTIAHCALAPGMVLFLGSLLLAPPPRLSLLPLSVPTLLCAHPTPVECARLAPEVYARLAPSVCAHPALCPPSLPRPVQQQHGEAQRRHSGHLWKERRMDSAQAVDPASAADAPCMSGGEPGTGWGGTCVEGRCCGGGCGTWAGAAGLPCSPDPASPHS